jgi:hypothetical protein
MDRSTLQDVAGPTVSTGGYNPTMSPSTNGVPTSQPGNTVGSSVQVSSGVDDIRNNGVPEGHSMLPFSTLHPNQNMEAVIPHAEKFQSTQSTPRKVYLLELPEHTYIMPAGPTLNFTMADILVILPNWFKKQQMATRFMNNGLTSAVHVAILQEHRTMNLSERELTRSRDGCSDQYRRTMRQMTPKWTKAGYRVSDDWNRQDITVNQFLPDAARNVKLKATPPVPFKKLMSDMKKLPQGPDAGDLTRALEYALQNQKIGAHGEVVEFLFPNDIHIILNQIGYATITMDHFDAAVIFRYDQMIKNVAATGRRHRRELESAGVPAPPLKRLHRVDPKASKHAAVESNISNLTNSSSWKHEPPQTQHAPSLQPYPLADFGHQPPISQHAALLPSQIRLTSSMLPNSSQVPYNNWYLQGSGALLEPENSQQMTLSSLRVPVMLSPSSQDSSAPVAERDGHIIDMGGEGFSKLPEPFHTSPGAEAAIEATLERTQLQRADELFLFDMEDIDALMAQHQDHNISALLTPFLEYGMGAIGPDNSYFHHPTQLLRECAEADDEGDFSALARAARFCRDPNNFSLEYGVGDLDFVAMLQGILE